MYDKRRKNGISGMGMLAMMAGMVPTAVIERLPEPKPPKQLTDEQVREIAEKWDRQWQIDRSIDTLTCIEAAIREAIGRGERG